MYEKSGVPASVESLPDYLEVELNKIANSINIPIRFTDAQFNDVNSGVNTRIKREGVQVWDSTSKKPVWATGRTPADVWIFGDGTVAYSPS